MIEAYEPPPPNDWVRPWARVVLLTLIAMGAAGWLAADGDWPLKMGMCVLTLVIEVWGYLSAVQWSRALARQDVGGAFAYWTLQIIGCSAWTIFSIYHALGMIAGGGGGYEMGVAAAPAYVAFTCLALSLPFHEWAIDRVERAPLKLAHTTASAPPIERPADPLIQERSRARGRPKRTARQSGRQSGRPMLTLIQNGALAALIAQMSFSPRDMEAFERAVLIAHEDPNLSQEELAARAGVPRQTIGRWMSEAPEVFRTA